MKYLILFLVLGLAYEGYAHSDVVQSTCRHAWSMVAGGAKPAQPPTADEADKKLSVTEAMAALPLPPVPAQAGSTVGASLPPTAPGSANSVAKSQKAAVAKYPELGVANSEMNSRFVFRYKRLLAEKSSRLQNADWPLQLADECAAAVAQDKAQTASRKASAKLPKLADVQKTTSP